jgi:hypothetical protein
MPEDNKYSRSKLLKLLMERFNEQELRTFCFILREKVCSEIDYDNFEGATKEAKIRELIDFILRRNLMSECIAELKMHRPDIDVEVARVRPKQRSPDPKGEEQNGGEDNGGVNHTWSDWRSWWRWCVIVPLVIILAIWIYEKLVATRDAYAISFAHGDLLLFSALLLFGVSVQVKTFQDEKFHLATMRHLRFFKWCARGGAVLLLLFFNFMKHCMSRNQCLSLTLNLEALNNYSGFTLSITIASIAFGYYTYWKIKKQAVNTGGQVR